MFSLFFDLDNPKLFILIRNRRRALKRIKCRKEFNIIACDYCAFAGIFYLKISSGRNKLIYAECRRREVPYILIF